MKVVLTGGGSGGHIRPLLAVASALKSIDPTCRIAFIGQKGEKFDQLLEGALIDEVHTVSAGKFRRYHSKPLLEQLTDIKMHALNTRDAARVVKGYARARRILKKLQPDVFFMSGGFVGVPVGVAAAHLKIPIITHDLDTVPGLANRIVGKWATVHAVGMPESFYSYPKATMRYVGVPISSDYEFVSAAKKKHFRHELGVDEAAPVLFIAGGSLGSVRLNAITVPAVKHLKAKYPHLVVFHQAGEPHVADVELAYRQALGDTYQKSVTVYGFISGQHRYTAAADIAVVRGGASTVTELAVQGKATILVPSRYLTGGHQVINAKKFAEAGEALMLEEQQLEKEPELLEKMIDGLLKNPRKADTLAAKLHAIAKNDAAYEIARLIEEVAKR